MASIGNLPRDTTTSLPQIIKQDIRPFYIKIGLKHQVLKLQTVSIVSNKISVICGKQIYYPQHSVDSVI